MAFISKLPWKEGEVPEDWTKATFVPVYKEKETRMSMGAVEK